jgi:hypothetical protein
MTSPHVDERPDSLSSLSSAPPASASLARIVARVDPFVREQIARQPLRLLGAAFVVGFALGGGLSSRVARFALLAAARYASRTIWRDVTALAVSGAIRSVPPAPSRRGAHRSPLPG